MKTQSPKNEPTSLILDDKREGITLTKPNFDLHLDLEKIDSFSGNKLPQNGAKHNTEKTVQLGSVPLLMSVAGWPGRLPPMGRSELNMEKVLRVLDMLDLSRLMWCNLWSYMYGSDCFICSIEIN
ncbi:hypothetical protein ACFX2G_035166 [Malus domestica]